MMWFSYQRLKSKTIQYVNLANYFVKFDGDIAKLFNEHVDDESLTVDNPADVTRLRELLDLAIKLQGVIVVEEPR